MLSSNSMEVSHSIHTPLIKIGFSRFRLAFPSIAAKNIPYSLHFEIQEI